MLVLLCAGAAVAGVALGPLLLRAAELAPRVRAPALSPAPPPGLPGEAAPAGAAAVPGPPSRGLRVAVAGVTGALFAAVAARVGADPALPAFLLFAASAVVLTVVDVRTRRLPDVVTVPTGIGVLVLLTAACLVEGRWAALAGALAGMVVLFAVYLALALLPPGTLGLGDVKYSAVVGLTLGWLGWSHVFLGTLLAYVLGAVAGAVLAVVLRTGWRTTVPFGPAMAAGALVLVLTGDAAAGVLRQLLA